MCGQVSGPRANKLTRPRNTWPVSWVAGRSSPSTFHMLCSSPWDKNVNTGVCSTCTTSATFSNKQEYLQQLYNFPSSQLKGGVSLQLPPVFLFYLIYNATDWIENSSNTTTLHPVPGNAQQTWSWKDQHHASSIVAAACSNHSLTHWAINFGEHVSDFVLSFG